jgi:hypothetical protein
MEIEDSGPNPERLAAAIRLHLGHASGPVPVYEIAEALDIVEIREAPMRGLEPDSKAYARARRLMASWMAAKVMKAARVSARFS